LFSVGPPGLEPGTT